MSKEHLLELLNENRLIEACGVIRSAKNYEEAEKYIFAILETDTDLLALALEVFLASRENKYKQHGYWVHSLSHFTPELWQRRKLSWIKQFNEVAFKGALELRDSNCCDRLLCDFAKYAAWNDNPADFHITPENTTWMTWESYDQHTKDRIELTFESEEALLKWRLKQNNTLYGWKREDIYLNLAKVGAIIAQLVTIGADLSEIRGLERALTERRLAALRAKIAENDPREEYMFETYRQEIADIETSLADIFPTD